ncbi:hypothetical protein [Bacillus sp. JCM 19041]|uniref:hypothetical protein n=1 Tax=Bacillus sp. JCM 19041 TaxID=1460637 RepID=UPI0006D01182
MNQAKVMYIIGTLLFVLNVIGFAIQGSLIGAGGLFLLVMFAFYMGVVFLYHRSESSKRIATLSILGFGVVAVIGAITAYAQGGYLLH